MPGTGDAAARHCPPPRCPLSPARLPLRHPHAEGVTQNIKMPLIKMLATKNATKTGALALFCVPRHVFGAVRSWGTRFRELFFATAAGTTMKRGFPNPPPNPPHLEIAGRRRRLKLGEKPNRFHQCRKLVPLALLLRASLLRVRACACACCVARIRCFRAFVAVRPCVPLLQFLGNPKSAVLEMRFLNEDFDLGA